MPLSETELEKIQHRNDERRRLKQAASPGPWHYDSYAFVHTSESIPRNERSAILVRPEQWFHSLGSRIDEGLPTSDAAMFEQGYNDAKYISESRSYEAEGDIDVLISEVRRLREIGATQADVSGVFS